MSGWYQQVEIFSNFNQRNGCLGDDVGELLFRDIMLLDAFPEVQPETELKVYEPDSL